MTAALTGAGALQVRRGIGALALLRLALRDLRSGLKGFSIFIACIALGVMTITAVGALSDALKAGFGRQGEAIIGGDLSLARMHAPADERERAWIASKGRVSETASMRSMARTLDGNEQALIELKGIDAAYPMAGSVELSGGATLDTAVRGGDVAAADPVLLERLGLKVGDRVEVGELKVEIKATVLAEPDAIIDRLTYGPRVFVSLETLKRTGLIKPGALIRWRYSVKLDDTTGNSATALTKLRQEAKSTLPQSGFTIVDRRDPSPQVSKTLERLRQFLTLLGLTALITGGAGVANAVATFVDRRRKVIATMRSLGASRRVVLSLLILQIMMVAAIGVAIGLALGTMIPPAILGLYGDALPIKAEISVSVTSVLIAAAYGFLVALLFALWPLGRAGEISASALFRDDVDEARRRWPGRPFLLAMTGVAGLMAGAAILSADSPKIASLLVAALVVVFLLFAGLGSAVTWLARHVKRPRRAEFRLAIGNIGAPDGLTRSVVLSLGSGLSLLVAVALADHSLTHELEGRLPQQSPGYFVLDIPKSDYSRFTQEVERLVPGSVLVDAPMLRGRLLKLGGRPVEEIKPPAEAQWVLNGDRGITYADEVPKGSKLVKGEWWPKDYAGEPLVSFEAELAEKLGVGIGDEVTVNVLGRNITARISNLREVKWESLALNFVMVFSPNTLAGAPHATLATITLPNGTPLADEVRMARALGQAFPSSTAIRVKDAIEAFNAIFAKVMTAVSIAGSVTLLAGALVLAGALATAQRRRVAEAVILKALGATRRRILVAHAAEYALLAGATSALAVAAGSLTAWIAVTQVMDIPFAFSAAAVLEALAIAAGLIFLFGGIGTTMVLSARPVPILRAE